MKNSLVTRINSISIVAILLGISSFSSCIKPPTSNGKQPSAIGSFDFATTADIQLNVNYALNDYSISFEVYTQNPMDEKDGMEFKRDDVQPVFRAITDEQGKFSGEMNVPTAVKTVFIYTKYIGVPTLITMPVSGQTVKLDLSRRPTASAGLSRAVSTRRDSVRGDLITLGGWNSMGLPDYLLSPVTLNGELINNIMFSLPDSKFGIGSNGDPLGLLNETEAVSDIRILKNTKINLVFMHEGASMNSALGYYCYPTGSMPAKREDLKRVVAIPNFSYAYSGGEASSGDRVQLKYWDGTKLVEEFPAGTTIGWFLVASGFRKPEAFVDGTSLMTYYSNPAYNIEANGKQHCVALRDANKQIIALGFEDQNRGRLVNGVTTSDSDFNDAVFFIEAVTENGIDLDGVPDIGTGGNTQSPDPADNFITYNGSLAFEDLWPSKGDYDMNDVVIDYKSTHYRNKNNQIIKIVDVFTPKWSGASINSGFGYQLGIAPSLVSTVNIEPSHRAKFQVFKTDGKGLELGQSKATIVLFENINDLVEYNAPTPTPTPFTVTVEFTTPIKIETLTAPPYNPFIVTGCITLQNTAGSRVREVHLPNKRPTDLADKSLLGTYNDKSDPSKNRYYISDENYMFALNLPVTFDFPEEKQRLEQAYSRYSSWVSSSGVNDADWYMDKRK